MKLTALFTLVLLVLTFSSCSPSLYFPDKVVSTSFEKKKDLMINVGVKPQLNSTDSGGRKGNSFSFSANAAYAFSNHFGAYIYYSHLSNRTVKENYLNYYNQESLTGGNFNGNRFEFGAVYYTPVAKDQCFELSVGYSRGNTNRTSLLTDSNNFRTKYYTISLQPSWSVRERGMTFSMGSKFWVQRYNTLDGSPYTQKLFTYKDIFLTEQNFWGLQPYMNLDVGFQFVRFNIQGSIPLIFRSEKYNIPIAGFPLHLGFGVSVKIDKNMFADFKTKKKY
ncbi:MAG: hypothetical protein QM530_09095 [Phycisphaerales bacterium]|nr:hypothetical protein [Phycisphaerales bacterium]